ncbi:hypothetical protein ES332_D13G276100v1 [Gossypium tomentosum]|nr:hypothetical protein ES332_D13G276100v1 [Gossypium tomentosum]
MICSMIMVPPADMRVIMGLMHLGKGDSCESIYVYKANHLFKARMSEEEADKVAGLEEVEYVEPCRYIKIMELN